MPSRRAFLNGLLSAAAGMPVSAVLMDRLTATAAAAVQERLARPSAAQTAWQDLEIGMFIHFGPNTWQDREYDDRRTPLSAINPDIDTNQWADVAVSLGARYIVFVAKHVGGFCMWQTTSSDYSIRNTPWQGGRGDVMADLAASCQARGLKLGVYLSPRDDHYGAGLSGKCDTPEKQEIYNRVARQQLTELVTRYGPLVEIWFDGSSVIPVGDILDRHASQSMIFQGPHATIRWVGNELGFAPYPLWNSIDRADARTGVATALHSDPLGDAWMPIEVDVSMRRPNWFWGTANHQNLLTLDALVEIYYRSVGRGAQLLLNMTPDRRGRIPEADADRAAEFGAEIRRRFGTSVGETAGRGRTLEIRLTAPRRVDHILIQEDLAFGERARRYQIEGRSSDGWVIVAEGMSIGHKRIQPVEPRELQALRITCSESAGEPHVRRVAAFGTGVAPPPTWADSAEIWADDEAGKWNGDAFELDLTKRVASAGEYRVRFVPERGEALEIGGVDLRLNASSRPDLVQRARGRQDVLLVKVPAPGQSVALSGRIAGARRGAVLVRRA